MWAVILLSFSTYMRSLSCVFLGLRMLFAVLNSVFNASVLLKFSLFRDDAPMWLKKIHHKTVTRTFISGQFININL